MKAPNFLIQDRHGGYQFRRKIPSPIREYFSNKREIRRSLRTHHRSTAIRIARLLAARTDQIFEELLRMARKNKYHDEAERLKVELALEESKLSNRLLVANTTIDDIQGLLEWLDVKPVTDALREKLEDADIKADIFSEYEGRERRRRLVEELELEQGLPCGALGNINFSSPIFAPPTITTPPPISEPISILWQAYRKEKRANKKWRSERIAKGFESHLRTFIELTRDLRPHEINVQTCLRYKDELLNYPARRFSQANEHKTLEELRSKTDKRLELATRNAHMTTISAFFDWLIQHDWMQINYFTTKKLIPRRDKRAERRDPFTKEDLALIFSQERFSGYHKLDWHYWTPILALYTGARMEELAQLRAIDIAESESEPGVHFINISIRDDFTPKTINGVRGIPIHAKLIELGFLEFVKSAGKGHLFPESPNSDGKRGSKMSNDFSRFKTSLGFGKKKVFHSFRNTFIGALSRAGVADSKVNALIGHAQDDLAFAQYWQINADELNAAAKLINFSEALTCITKWIGK